LFVCLFNPNKKTTAQSPATESTPQIAEQRIHQLLSLKKALELLPTLCMHVAPLQADVLVRFAAKLNDPRFALLLGDITAVLHPDVTLLKARGWRGMCFFTCTGFIFATSFQSTPF